MFASIIVDEMHNHVASWDHACSYTDLFTSFSYDYIGTSLSSYGLVGDFPDEMRALRNLEHVEFSEISLDCIQIRSHFS